MQYTVTMHIYAVLLSTSQVGIFGVFDLLGFGSLHLHSIQSNYSNEGCSSLNPGDKGCQCESQQVENTRKKVN